MYEDAITELMAAYRIRDDAALLYDIAQAHRLAGHASEALRFYRVYLSTVPRAANRDDIEVKMAEQQKPVEQQRKTQTQMPPDLVIAPAAGTDINAARTRAEKFRRASRSAAAAARGGAS